MVNLKEKLSVDGLVIAPGVIDAISARAVELAGFPACYMTGSGVSAAHGYPDMGLLTQTEMAASVRRISSSVAIPLIADGDTGYGNELNVIRAVREYEFAGAAAIQIEDQVFPKRCGHFEKKQIIENADFLNKIRAAVSARNRPDFLIIARTDAIALEGFDAAIDRANAAIDAGADVAFVEAPIDLDQMRAIPNRVKGPCLLNIVWRGKSPPVRFEDVEDMGYKIAILPSILLKSYMGIVSRILEEAKEIGEHPVPPGDIDIKAGADRAAGAEWKYYRDFV
ncbi:Isocitrate lyase/PEP mutase family protein [Hyphomicrobiales bacterium]|nr:Isocitrate lyase/PEP mutase family protein [Hyphomicrobiales bacterium]CAH1675616.1 Isocitrate lyase/PEP mutase family protein [Hyphomicrobiales bacterium]